MAGRTKLERPRYYRKVRRRKYAEIEMIGEMCTFGEAEDEAEDDSRREEGVLIGMS